MKIKLLSILVVVAMLAGCGTGKTSNKSGKPALWEFIPNESPVETANRSAQFKLNKQVFIDSFVHYEAKTHGKNPEIKLLMPLPNLDGQTDDYYFSPIYDAGPHKDTVTLGFIGVNSSNKRDISSLYIRDGLVTVKWNTSEKNWILNNPSKDRNSTIYTLLDLDAKDQPKLAPIPENEY